MSVSLKSIPCFVACLAAPLTASVAAAQETNGTIRPTAGNLAAKIDSIVQVDVLAESSTIYQVGSLTKQLSAALALKLVDCGGRSLSNTLERFFKGLEPEFNAITNGEVTGFVARSSGTERTLKRIK